MKLSSALAVLTAGLLVAASQPALARSSSIPPQMMGRLDAFGRLAGDAPFCEMLGYTRIDSGDAAFEREALAVGARAGVDEKDAQAIMAEGKAREGDALKAQQDAVLPNVKDPASDHALRAFAEDLSVKCHRAADDPLGSMLLKPPVGVIDGVDSIARRFVDKQLAPYGRAGWQSLYILAGGDLSEAVGTCEARISRPQGHAYMAPLRDPTRFPPDIADEVQAYFDLRVARGRDAARHAPPSADRCQKLLAKQNKALQKAPVD